MKKLSTILLVIFLNWGIVHASSTRDLYALGNAGEKHLGSSYLYNAVTQANMLDIIDLSSFDNKMRNTPSGKKIKMFDQMMKYAADRMVWYGQNLKKHLVKVNPKLKDKIWAAFIEGTLTVFQIKELLNEDIKDQPKVWRRDQKVRAKIKSLLNEVTPELRLEVTEAYRSGRFDRGLLEEFSKLMPQEQIKNWNEVWGLKQSAEEIFLSSTRLQGNTLKVS